MTYLFGIVLICVIVLWVPYFYRVLAGPSLFDRILALNGMGTKVPVMMVLVGLIYGRLDMFVDIALALFLLNLVTTLLVAKYVRERGSL